MHLDPLKIVGVRKAFFNTVLYFEAEFKKNSGGLKSFIGLIRKKMFQFNILNYLLCVIDRQNSEGR